MLTKLPAAAGLRRRCRAHRSSSATPRPPRRCSKGGRRRRPRRGVRALNKAGDCDAFVAACRKLRFWDRAAAER